MTQPGPPTPGSPTPGLQSPVGGTAPAKSWTLAVALVHAALAAGVRDVVLCPGSRSAPLAYAFVAAEERGLVRLWVRTDERAAGFLALGMARAGRPAAVVTTSGTAVANLHPAMLEAHHGGVPLVAVTADRPRRLRGTWANQTTEAQHLMFGAVTRATLDLADGDLDATPDAAARLGAALAAATAPPRPGPVHLNLGFDEPLTPPPTLPLTPADGAAIVPPDPGPGVDPAAVREPPRAVRLGTERRTLIVAGDGAGPAARTLAEETGWPLLAEPSSGARGGPALVPYRLLLELPALVEGVERVVVYGRPTLSRPVTRLLERADVELVLVGDDPAWPVPPRPVHRAAGVVAATAGGTARVWAEGWQRAGAAARVALDAELDAIGCDTGPLFGPLFGPVVARAVARATGPGQALVAASSNAVRDLDLAAPPLPAEAVVLANRGLAGIDGTLSTATGFALATGRPTRVLIGDLAFLHDVTGLLAAPGEPRPTLQVIVVNDAGGGIFSLLEYGALAARGPAEAGTFERVFGTPHRADLGALCRGVGVGHRRVAGPGELDDALARPADGIEVLEVPASRDGLRAGHARVRDAVRAAVTAVL